MSVRSQLPRAKDEALAFGMRAAHDASRGARMNRSLRRVSLAARILLVSLAAIGVGATVSACSDTAGSSVASGDAGGDGGGGGADSASRDGASGCRSDSECNHARFELCARVEDPQCGGVAPPQQCGVDTDCADAGANDVCVFEVCGAHRCQPRCTSNAACPSNPPGLLTCSATSGKCEAKSCAQASDCPTNFACGASHVCVVKTCTIDAECSGVCVGGRCSATAGVCTQPAA